MSFANFQFQLARNCFLPIRFVRQHYFRHRSLLGALVFLGTLGVTFSATLLPASAQACTCDTQEDLEQALEKASIVFVGQVKGKVENPLRKEQWEVRFSVNRKLKGFEEVPGSAVLVYTPKDKEYCGLKFQDGMDYLVFASGNPAHFQTTSCSRTEMLDKVLTDVHKLIRLTGNVETRGK